MVWKMEWVKQIETLLWTAYLWPWKRHKTILPFFWLCLNSRAPSHICRELMCVFASSLILVCPCVVVHRSTLFMSLSLLLQKCPICLVHLTWMFCEMGDKWPYNCYFICTLLGFVKNIMHHPCVVPIKLFLQALWWCINTIVLTWLQLWRISILFYF